VDWPKWLVVLLQRSCCTDTIANGITGPDCRGASTNSFAVLPESRRYRVPGKISRPLRGLLERTTRRPHLLRCLRDVSTNNVGSVHSRRCRVDWPKWLVVLLQRSCCTDTIANGITGDQHDHDERHHDDDRD